MRLLFAMLWHMAVLVPLHASEKGPGGEVASKTPAPRKLKDIPVTEANIHKAVERALPPLWKGLEGYNETQTCFACHHHGVGLLAFGTARSRGYEIDEKELQEQIDYISADLERSRPNFEKGKGPGAPGGGETDNTGYALLGLAAVGHKPDKATTAIVNYTLGHQKTRPYWCTLTRRYPTEASSFTTTALNIRGLMVYRNKEQIELADKRIAEAKDWLLETAAKDTEDRVFRLIGLKAATAEASEVKKAMEELQKTQREDGGWGQLDTMSSDPYATATALYALHTAGGVAVEDAGWQKGVRFLLGTQEDDGSWFVKSRSKPVQKQFDSGFPHGKDQFISCAATGWATAVLALATPLKK